MLIYLVCYLYYFIADGTLKLWDLRHLEQPNGTYPHGSEVLCCDWMKTDEVIIKIFTRSFSKKQ